MMQPTIETTYRLSPGEQPSIAVVSAVAEAEDVDPVDLQTPLYEVVDPDALDRLFGPAAGRSSAGGHVTIIYAGYGVTIDASGQLSVSQVDEAGHRAPR